MARASVGPAERLLNMLGERRACALVYGSSFAISLILCIVLIPRLGPLGAAIALVSSDLVAQSGVLFVIIVGETLKHPVRHALSLVAAMAIIVPAGVAVGAAIRYLLPGSGIPHFLIECTLWLAAAALIASPLTSKGLRDRLIAAMPR